MISERPLLGRVDVQVEDGSSWRTVLPDSTGLSIRRGGSRSGLGVKTDVGLCTVALLNAEDPVDGGTLTPGQPMRVMANGTPAIERGTVATYGFEDYAATTYPTLTAYTQTGFQSAGWSYTLANAGGSNFTGAQAYNVTVESNGSTRFSATGGTTSGTGGFTASRTVTGLTIGRSYSFSARIATSTLSRVRISTGAFSSSWVAGTGASLQSHYSTHTVSFVASSTSQVISFEVSDNPADSSTTSNPGMNVDDVSVASPSYTDVTNNGQDGWQAINGSELASTTTQKYAGNRSLSISAAEASAVQAFRYLDGLVIGDEYTVTAWFYASSVAARSASIYTSTTAYVTPVLLPNEVWTQRSYTFTATTTAVDLYIVSGSTGVIYVDAVTITRRTPAVLGDEIFTGTIVDIAASYPLDKETGETRSVVQVTVSDAVRVHATTPRYGVTLSTPFFETFEDRIARLALSSQTPVEVPVNDAPREVYAF